MIGQLPTDLFESRPCGQWRVKALLGEGPHWIAGSQTFQWIDILKPSVNFLDPATGISVEMTMPSKVTAAIPTDDGGILVALEDGLWLRDRHGAFSCCASPDMTGVQFNDGKCDPIGRFWVGSRSSDGSPGRGKLHSLGLDGVFREAADGFDVCNGLGWSPDGTAFYLIDTIPRILYRFDYDCTTGRISGRTILRRFSEDEGKPDGLAVDARGNIWCAMWDGGGIRILSSDGGDQGWLPIACPRPTSCAFGGASGDLLFVTTASVGTDLNASPSSGSIMAYRTMTTGAPLNAFRTLRA
jgi:sugar lactone lactonase YvrE